ncbi:unnamed protein product [Didymodactylos carnosus]|uniref:Uncharacterized protein n=1 Tax=Didymodactylos carnosus TaxID=1234261 RepID=A0A813VWT8_9BILA|nr:unnamed protein product [Didymodactylos carnosus]CAF0849268.1 unnamed protein product [Didymodactylos carnosus]CAF3607313.1 unnamed protein product [Didymodactylos carnosus]CAF3636784.1 unnamed protein product [Didymodactylos carnosus]
MSISLCTGYNYTIREIDDYTTVHGNKRLSYIYFYDTNKTPLLCSYIYTLNSKIKCNENYNPQVTCYYNAHNSTSTTDIQDLINEFLNVVKTDMPDKKTSSLSSNLRSLEFNKNAGNQNLLPYTLWAIGVTMGIAICLLIFVAVVLICGREDKSTREDSLSGTHSVHITNSSSDPFNSSLSPRNTQDLRTHSKRQSFGYSQIPSTPTQTSEFGGLNSPRTKKNLVLYKTFHGPKIVQPLLSSMPFAERRGSARQRMMIAQQFGL